MQIGQTIRLPGVDSIGGPVVEDTQAAANAVEEEESSGDTFVRRYTVQKGDTLVGIATIYGISWEDLAAENRLNKSSVISVGEQLRIPGAVKRVEQPAEATTDENSVQATTETETVSAATTTTAESAAPEYYVVKTGDTIISIAVRNDMGWQELLTLNNLTENSILQLGQKVRVR